MSDLRDVLLLYGAVKIGDFTLASGTETDHYVDIKRASTQPLVLKIIGQKIADHVGTSQLIAGMELGAIPLAVSASLVSGIPFLMVRKQPKEYGAMSQIEGIFEHGMEVLVVEDVTTSGMSSVMAINVLREVGLKVNKVISVVDREVGAEQVFADIGVELISLVKISELLS